MRLAPAPVPAGPRSPTASLPRHRHRHRHRIAWLCGVALALAGCSPAVPPAAQAPQSPEPGSSPDGRPLVLTTFTVLADMARHVAGDRLRVASITKVGSEIHSYEPTPSDLRRAQGAVLVLENGLNLERWSRRFTDNVQGARRVVVSEGIEPLPIRSDPLAPPGAEPAETDKPNPHAWMSPRLAKRYVDNIRDAFIALDPAGAPGYRQRAEVYKQELGQLDQSLRQALARVPANQRLLVSCEGAFSYLARDYGLQEGYLWPVNGEGQATPRRQALLIDTVRQRKVPAVFCESTVNEKGMRQVAAASGARYGGTFYVDSLSPPDGPAPSLLKLQRHNVDLIVKGLSHG